MRRAWPWLAAAVLGAGVLLVLAHRHAQETDDVQARSARTADEEAATSAVASGARPRAVSPARTPRSAAPTKAAATGLASPGALALQGTVHDARTLQPILRFQVATKIDVPGRGLVRSTREIADPHGRFTLTDLPALPRYVEVSAPGYRDARRDTADHPPQQELSFALEPIRHLVLIVHETRGVSLAGADLEFRAVGETTAPTRRQRPWDEWHGRLDGTRHPDCELHLVIEEVPACAMRLHVALGPDREAQALVDFPRLETGEHRVPITLPAGLPRGKLVLGFAEVSQREWTKNGVRLSLPRLQHTLDALARRVAPAAAEWPIAMPRSLQARTAEIDVEVLTPDLRHVASTSCDVEEAARMPKDLHHLRSRHHPLPIVELEVPRMDLLVKVKAGTLEFTHTVSVADFTEQEPQAAAVWLLFLPDR